MENNHIHDTSRVAIDSNPANSKLLQKSILNLFSGENPIQAAFDVTEEAVNMFYAGTELNTFDVPCYLAALDIIKESLMTLCSSEDIKVYEKIKEHTVVNTLHMTHDDDSTEDTDNEDT